MNNEKPANLHMQNGIAPIGGGLRTSHWIDVQMDLGKVLSSDITASIYIYTNHPIIQRIEIPVLFRSKCLQANE